MRSDIYLEITLAAVGKLACWGQKVKAGKLMGKILLYSGKISQ